MLRKLLKHEFRATARIMGPLYGIMLVLSVCANFSARVLLNGNGSTGSHILAMLGSLLMVAFVIGMIALVVMSIVLMVNRFRTNLMGDEGYVMFTLPVSSHQLVWSKIIVSTVWFIATFVVECLAGLISFFDISFFRDVFSSEFFHRMGEELHLIVTEFGLNLPAMALEIIVLCLLACAVLCLGFYAALATGHSFPNHKMALSVLFFFVFQFVGGAILMAADSLYGRFFDWTLTVDGMGVFHLMMLFGILCTLAVGAVYYVITAVMLKKRLNLE